MQGHPEHASHDNADLAAAIIGEFDVDGDGDIDGDELARAVVHLEALATPTIDLRIHDTPPYDGQVSKAELSATLDQHCDPVTQTCVKDVFCSISSCSSNDDTATVVDEIFKKYDDNNDGFLDKEERASANADLNEADTGKIDLASADSDGDGDVDVAELTVTIAKFCDPLVDGHSTCQRDMWLKDHPEEAKAIIKEHDTNGDGKLEGEELIAATPAVAAAIINEFDVDGDGDIDGEELAKANAYFNTEVGQVRALKLCMSEAPHGVSAEEATQHCARVITEMLPVTSSRKYLAYTLITEAVTKEAEVEDFFRTMCMESVLGAQASAEDAQEGCTQSRLAATDQVESLHELLGVVEKHLVNGMIPNERKKQIEASLKSRLGAAYEQSARAAQAETDAAAKAAADTVARTFANAEELLQFAAHLNIVDEKAAADAAKAKAEAFAKAETLVKALHKDAKDFLLPNHMVETEKMENLDQDLAALLKEANEKAAQAAQEVADAAVKAAAKNAEILLSLAAYFKSVDEKAAQAAQEKADAAAKAAADAKDGAFAYAEAYVKRTLEKMKSDEKKIADAKAAAEKAAAEKAAADKLAAEKAAAAKDAADKLAADQLAAAKAAQEAVDKAAAAKAAQEASDKAAAQAVIDKAAAVKALVVKWLQENPAEAKRLACDTNGDGSVDATERSVCDANSDGNVDDNELVAIIKKQHDTNDDGELDVEELKAAADKGGAN